VLAADTIVCPVLVGRAQYVAPYDQVLESVAQGRGRTIAISGEAGVGKSRLANELAARSRAALPSLTMLEGRCFERDASLPFAPIVDLLRAFVAPLGREEVRRRLDVDACEIVKLLPELHARLPEYEPSPALDAEQEKRRLFHALLQFFERIATEGPALALLEDLHWSDETSLEFLSHLARRSVRSPIVLLLTYRADEVGAPLAHFLAGLDRERAASEWPLDRLELDHVAAMVSAIFKSETPPRHELVRQLFEITDGNPYFVEEVLKSLSGSGADLSGVQSAPRTTLEGVDVPRSVQDAVRQRSARVSEAAQRLLMYAAVAGRRFDLALLERVSGTPEPQMLPLLKELLAAHIVVEESDDRFAFRHALTQQAIYSALLARERRLVHREIAEALEALAPADDDARLAEMAHHFYEAGLWERAFDYSIKIGERALELYSPAAAVQHFTRALEAANHAGTAPPAWVYSARGDAYQLLGEFEHARADHEQSLAIARGASDTAAEWRALVDLGFLWAARDYDRSGEFFRRSLDLARAGDDLRLLGRSLNRMGNWLVNTGRSSEGIEEHHAALEIFREAGDVAGTGATLDLLGMAYGIQGDLPSAVARVGEAIPLLTGDDVRLMSALSSLAVYGGTNHADVVPAALRSLDDVRRDGEAALALAERTGASVGLSYAYWSLGAALGSFGLFGEAVALTNTGLRIAREVGHAQWTIGGQFTLAQIHLHMLDAEAALAELESAWLPARSLKSALWIGSIGSYLALAALRCGDRQRAAAVLAEADPSNEPPCTLGMRRVAWARAELALAEGAPEIAISIVDGLLTGQPGSGGRHIPLLLATRARALLEIGDPRTASDNLADAREEAAAAGALPWLWRINAELGGALDRQGRRAEAEQAYVAARETLGRLAMSFDDESARARFLEAAEALLPRQRVTPRRAAALASGGLTEREREVAEQVMLGRTNREIADALVVSERTVETHVANIFAKLGFTSRSQLAAWAADRAQRQA
jgi:DNA-binding CsgD family transcriptional regulator